jgi:hypothetical protein
MIDTTLLASSSIGLIVLFILANLADRIFHIYRNSFYSLFHFIGGAVSFLFWYSLTGLRGVSLLLVLITGVVWEIYEWIRWKYFTHKKHDKPENKDTLNDLVFDILGGTVELLLLTLI